MYFAEGGQGSYIPFVVFWGWAALPFALDPGTGTFLAPPLLQITVYMAAWVVACGGIIPWRVLKLVPLLHAAGSLVSFFKLSFTHHQLIATWSGLFLYLLSYPASIVLVVFYWIVYLQSAANLPYYDAAFEK